MVATLEKGDAMTYYKVLSHDRKPLYGGRGRWPYRKWTRPILPRLCERGYHIIPQYGVSWWLGNRIWEVEYKGMTAGPNPIWQGSPQRWHRDGKMAVESARLVRLTDWRIERHGIPYMLELFDSITKHPDRDWINYWPWGRTRREVKKVLERVQISATPRPAVVCRDGISHGMSYGMAIKGLINIASSLTNWDQKMQIRRKAQQLLVPYLGVEYEEA